MHRTTSSLAMISAIIDVRNHDFLDCFIPFLATLICEKGYREIDPAGVGEDFETFFGLSVPYHPMQALITRATKRGIIRKDHQRFYAVQKAAKKLDFSKRRKVQLGQFEEILTAIVSFSDNTLRHKLTIDRAEKALISLLHTHDHDMLFLNADGDESSVLPRVKPSKKDRFAVYRFVQHVARDQTDHLSALVQMAAGHLMADAILVAGMDGYTGRPEKLCVYLDTRIVLRLLGLEGQYRHSAHVEFVKLMRDLGAHVFVFRHTLDEVNHTLKVCERWIGHPRYDPRRAGVTLRYLVESGYEKSDLMNLIANLESRLDGCGVKVAKDINLDEDRAHCPDEEKLTGMIGERYNHTWKGERWRIDQAVVHDVKCLSCVLWLRKGRKAHSLPQSGHVFITENAALAGIAAEYERTVGGGSEISSCLTDIFVGTVLWGLSPNSMRTVITKNLIADCQAGLQPDEELLEKYMAKCEELRERDDITSDEYLLLRSHGLAMSLLVDMTMGDPAAFVDRLPGEILEALKAEARRDAESERDQARGDLALTRASLDAERAERRVMQGGVQLRCGGVGEYVSWAIFVIVAVAALYGFIGTLVYGFASSWWAWIPVVLYLLLAVFNMFCGIHLWGTRKWLAGRIEKKAQEWFLGPSQSK